MGRSDKLVKNISFIVIGKVLYAECKLDIAKIPEPELRFIKKIIIIVLFFEVAIFYYGIIRAYNFSKFLYQLFTRKTNS